jgi:outer membrane protein
MKKIVSIATAVALSSSLYGDFIGFEAGGAMWYPKTTGTFQNGSTTIDLEKDLNYGDTIDANYIWAWIDHPLPLIPNAKVTHTKTDETTNSTLTKTINFAGKDYTANTKINTEMTLEQTDFTIYYRILDNWINLDLGLTAKNIKGKLSINTASAQYSSEKDFEFWLPMAYAKGKFDFPFTGLSVEVEANYIGFNGHKIYDAKAGVVYETSIGLGVVAGVRQEKILVDDLDGISSDIDMTGVYAGLFYHF